MKITACYIVKDEAAVLPRSLASIAGAWDELLVVDTGSTDDTAALARQAGARVLPFAWQDDFSAARNYALAQATGDWLIFLDADEAFTEATRGHIRQAIAAHAAADVLLVRRDDVDAAGEVMGTIYVPRIMRRKDGLRYMGIIHEELCQHGEPVRNVAWLKPEELALTHTGYAGKLGEQKARRNLRLLTLAQRQSAHPEHYDSYLAETYFGLDDIAQAMRYAQRDIARGRQRTTYASKSWRILLQCLLTCPAWQEAPAAFTPLAGQQAAASPRLTAAQAWLQVADHAVAAFPELPDFYAEQAEARAALLDFAGAVQAMQRALQLAPAYQGIEPGQFQGAACEQGRERLALWQRILARAQELQLTACCIAKDEAANIGVWAANAAAYSDRRLVVDTGSTDDTVQLATQAGCEVAHFNWCDDFAAAKNAALALIPATEQSWVAFLDADEQWLEPERVRPYLAWLSITQPEAEAVQCPLHNVDPTEGGRSFHSFPAVRLFRRQKGLGYQGRVHETLQHADGHAIWTWQEQGALQLRHTGYRQDQVAAKARRNLALLDQEGEDNPRLWRYRADAYMALGNLEQAERCGLQAILSPWQGQGSENDMYWLVLTCMQLREEKWEDRFALAQAAVAKFPQLPDYPARIGLALYRRGESEALTWLRRARQLAAAGGYAGGQASHYGEIAAEVAAVWALCEAQAASGGEHAVGGDVSAQQAALAAAMREQPAHEPVLTAFADWQLLHGADTVTLARAIDAYLPASEQQTLWLAHWAERHGYLALYRHYAQELAQRYQRTLPRAALYAMVEAGEWEQLGEACVQALSEDTRQLVALLLALEQQEDLPSRQLALQAQHVLPATAESIWRAYVQGTALAEGAPLDGWNALWPLVRQYGTAAQATRFAALVRQAAPQSYHQCAKEMQEDENWQGAAALFGELVQEPQAAADCWQDLGICMYHLGEYDAMQECFAAARQAGLDTPAMQAFATWAEEAAAR